MCTAALPVVDALLAMGADAAQQDKHGTTALMLAPRNRHVDAERRRPFERGAAAIFTHYQLVCVFDRVEFRDICIWITIRVCGGD